MSDVYLVRIAVWPFSGVDQAFARPRDQLHVVRADDIRGALSGAELIARGLSMNPAVWRAPIREISLRCGGDRIDETQPPAGGALWFRPHRPASADVDGGTISANATEAHHGG